MEKQSKESPMTDKLYWFARLCTLCYELGLGEFTQYISNFDHMINTEYFTKQNRNKM